MYVPFSDKNGLMHPKFGNNLTKICAWINYHLVREGLKKMGLFWMQPLPVLVGSA